LAQRFLDSFDRTRDIGWVAEVDGKLAGCSLLKGLEGSGAELTLLLMERDCEDGELARELDRSRDRLRRGRTVWACDSEAAGGR
jgi:hypothetical protein